ncbi:MAG TPA: DNA polymerase III subunit beta [Saprospiraceae bacterium]|nr:DNA polymerase III subunit beta [Saprospiraceae bacterium]
MKFEVSSTELLKNLNLAYTTITPNPLLPVAEDFLMKLDGNVLSIKATNLEVTISTSFEVTGLDDGAIAVPAKKFYETLKALPDQPISFEVEPENNSIKLASAYGVYRLGGDNPDEFPATIERDNTESFSFNAGSLSQAFAKTIFAASSDDMKPNMNGVLVQVDFNKIIFVASDGHKLVKYTFGNINSEISNSFILHKKCIGIVQKALENDVNVDISFNTKNAFFDINGTLITCRLIDGKFPDYNAVIPVDNPNVLTLNRRDFLNALRRLSIYSNQSTYQVILNISDGSLTMSAKDLDFSNEATEQMPCKYEGEPMLIGFNAKFMAEMLSVLDTEEVYINLSQSNRPGIMVPSDEPDDESLMMLVMPILVNN